MRHLLLICTLFTIVQNGSAIESPEITLPELRDHVSFLASDSLKGRKPGTEESKIAADYIKKHMTRDAVDVLYENGFQEFEFTNEASLGKNNYLSFGDIQGIAGETYVPLSYSENTSLVAPVVFVGYGFEFDSDSLAWHDYDGVEVNRKWVLILRGYPQDKSTEVFEAHSPLRKKVLLAKDMGAAGVLFVSGPTFDEDDLLQDLRYEQNQGSAGIPVLHIKRELADRLLASLGKNVEKLEKDAGLLKGNSSFDIDEELRAEIEIVKIKTPTRNVVVGINGSDPLLKDEYIVIGAHYDHLGFGGPGSTSRRPDTLAIHNGADDNASGVATILEILEKCSAERQRFKRSLIFVAFAAEELGTLGSKYFTEHPPITLEQIKCMFNVDMVGRMETEDKAINVSGTGTAVGLEELVESCAKVHDIKTRLSPEGFGPSDHAAFYIKDIPVLSFMTRIHEDYHTPDDDVDKINFEGHTLISRFIYELLLDVANRPQALVYQEAGPKSRPDIRSRFKVTLGIMPDIAGSDIKGLRADAVIPGRPAARAGLEKGDIIVALNGKPVNDIYEYMHRLAEFKPGDRISVDVLRNGEKVILIVDL